MTMTKPTKSRAGHYPTIARLLFAVLVAGCAAAPPEPLEFTNQESVEATVTAVDQERRMVTLRGPQGNKLTLRAGPAVRNLAQVEAGDTLRVSYYSSFHATMSEPGTTANDAALGAARAREGTRPGALLAATTSTTIEVVSVAADGTSVSFRNEAGELESLDVQREQAQEFARKLQRGDMVDLEYSEAVAIEVEATADP